mgnify:FL=1
MPSMYDIYDRDARGYDALVAAEDYEGNLCRTLRGIVVWNDARVVEAGIGTGRVTRCYVDVASRVQGYDRSAHMLARARENLASWADRVELAPADHRALPAASGAVDVFVEGWAFGHAVVDAASGAVSASPDSAASPRAAVERVAAELVAEARRVVRPGGTVIVVETLGTNVDRPGAPLPELADFYRALENRYGFEREVIRTDYRFDSPQEAEKRCRFFFGDDVADGVRSRGSAVVPEYTGVWWTRT